MNVIVPNRLKELTLGQYQHFQKLEGDDDFLGRKMVEIFCNIKMEVIKQMKVASITKINETLLKAFSERPEFQMTFKMEGVEYGFIPNLDELTFGELHDIETTIGDWQKMNETMAVLYRPIIQKMGKRYRIKDYDADALRAELMRKMPLDIVMGSMVFFCDLGMDLSKTFLKSLTKEKEINSAAKDNLQDDGAGFPYSILLLKEMLPDLMKFPGLTLPSPSPTSPSKKTKQKPKIKS
jgi:hypothetical protein